MKIDRVLAVGAHPDDIEALCAGTLIRYQELGAQVTLAIVTDGSSGHNTLSADELKPIRRKEAQAAADLIKAELCLLEFRDAMLFAGQDLRLALVDVLRRSGAQVVITHKAEDYHADHRAVSAEVRAACFAATLHNIQTSQKTLAALPQLFYLDSWINAAGFGATDYVDISTSFELKMKMLRCHKSQYEWLQKHDATDMFALIESNARSAGHRCGVKYAESFRLEANWPFVRPFRILP